MVTNQVDFSALYAQDDLEGQRMRYERLAARFGELFQDLGTPRFFSAPGRTEISGNHTDHQLGRVLAASVNFLARSVVSPTSRPRNFAKR